MTLFSIIMPTIFTVFLVGIICIAINRLFRRKKDKRNKKKEIFKNKDFDTVDGEDFYRGREIKKTKAKGQEKEPSASKKEIINNKKKGKLAVVNSPDAFYEINNPKLKSEFISRIKEYNRKKPLCEKQSSIIMEYEDETKKDVLIGPESVINQMSYFAFNKAIKENEYPVRFKANNIDGEKNYSFNNKQEAINTITNANYENTSLAMTVNNVNEIDARSR